MYSGGGLFSVLYVGIDLGELVECPLKVLGNFNGNQVGVQAGWPIRVGP